MEENQRLPPPWLFAVLCGSITLAAFRQIVVAVALSGSSVSPGRRFCRTKVRACLCRLSFSLGDWWPLRPFEAPGIERVVRAHDLTRCDLRFAWQGTSNALMRSDAEVAGFRPCARNRVRGLALGVARAWQVRGLADVSVAVPWELRGGPSSRWRCVLRISD